MMIVTAVVLLTVATHLAVKAAFAILSARDEKKEAGYRAQPLPVKPVLRPDFAYADLESGSFRSHSEVQS